MFYVELMKHNLTCWYPGNKTHPFGLRGIPISQWVGLVPRVAVRQFFKILLEEF